MAFRPFRRHAGGLQFLSVVIAVGLAGFAGKANADQLYIQATNSASGVNRPVLSVDHTNGATEGLDGKDSSFIPRQNPSKSIDFYSSVSFDPYKLSLDARPPESFSTILSEIYGRNLTSSVSSNLAFTITDDLSENIFATKNIFADLYTPTDTLLGTYNVKDYAANGTTIPITVNNGLSYKLDIRFTPTPEPSTLTLLGIGAAAMAFGWWRRRRNALRAA